VGSVNGITRGVHHECYDCRCGLAKDGFELALADAAHRIMERKRLRRSTFAGDFDNRVPLRIVMGARSSE
jgi:hypothetical protein